MYRRLLVIIIYGALNTGASNFFGTSFSSSSSSADNPNYFFQTENSLFNVRQPKIKGIRPLIQTRAGIAQLAYQTQTNPRCYMLNTAPVSITDLRPIMGTWYETYKFTDNETQQHLCEEVTYTLKNKTYFYKDAVVNIPYTVNGETFYNSVAISGYGILLHPGVVDIYWKDLDTGEPDSLVYMILGTDYVNYLIGYTCENGAKKPEIVFNTRTRNPTREDIQKGIEIVESLNLPLAWIGCVAKPL